MSRVKDIESEIEELRDKLNYLINETNSLTELQVVEMSEDLDDVLNIYNEVAQDSKA